MCSCGQRLPAPVEQLQPSVPQTKSPLKDIITAANPPDLTGAERVDLSTWGKQAKLGGGADGGSLPAAAGLVASSSTQNIIEEPSGGGEEDIWTGGWI